MVQPPTEVQVRAGLEADLGRLTDIYNHYIHETAITFDTIAFTPEERLPWLRLSSCRRPAQAFGC